MQQVQETEAQVGHPKANRFTRRGFIKSCLWGGGATAALGAGSLAYARYVEPFSPRLEKLGLTLDKASRGLNGLTLLQLSDLHLADTESQAYLERELDNCRSLRPDLVFLTGDYVTRGDDHWIRNLSALTGRIQARHGIFAVLGNHDYCVYRNGGGITPPRSRNADQIAEALTRSGIQVLRNESRRLELPGGMLHIAGIDDLWSGRFDPTAAFGDVDPALPCIALGHNPDMVDRILDYRWDWLLCGHTHGGQVRLPLIGAPLLPLLNKTYDQGLFELGEKRMYVNRGLGYLRPLRLNCPPEITEFQLVTHGNSS